jgi:hypothetical protein
MTTNFYFDLPTNFESLNDNDFVKICLYKGDINDLELIESKTLLKSEIAFSLESQIKELFNLDKDVKLIDVTA